MPMQLDKIVLLKKKKKKKLWSGIQEHYYELNNNIKTNKTPSRIF